MKKFVVTLLLFLLPYSLYFAFNELYCRTQTTFAIKKNFIDKNAATFQMLVLGSSHLQNAINPEFLSIETCNLAFGGQPISIDYFLLEKYIDKMPKLSTVIIEISPHRFYDDLNPIEWNAQIYSTLYHINYKSDQKFSFKNFALVASNFRFFTSVFNDYINPFSFKYHSNEYGFITNDFYDRFSKLNYDTIKINSSYKMLHQFNNYKNKVLNERFLNLTLETCKRRGVKAMFITPPFYKTYLNQIPVTAQNEVNEMVKRMVEKFEIEYHNFSDDKRFNVQDFKNDNHLNSDGAKKLTVIVDRLITHSKN